MDYVDEDDEDPGDRQDREAHGFGYEDNWQDKELLCKNGCGLSYYEIVCGKIRDCQLAERERSENL